MRLNRIAGSVLVAAGILGFFTVADELRHVGEFIGVSSILLAGLILLAGGFEHRLTKLLPWRWTALGVLSGIMIGAGLDNMVVGVAIGMTMGAMVGFALLRKHRPEKGEMP